MTKVGGSGKYSINNAEERNASRIAMPLLCCLKVASAISGAEKSATIACGVVCIETANEAIEV